MTHDEAFAKVAKRLVQIAKVGNAKVSQPMIQLFKATVGVVETSGEAETETANVSLLGKLGSLKLYHALAVEFNGRLNAAAAERGLVLFAEHVADAAAHPGKHPNIDLLVRVKNENLALQLRPLAANP